MLSVVWDIYMVHMVQDVISSLGHLYSPCGPGYHLWSRIFLLVWDIYMVNISKTIQCYYMYQQVYMSLYN